MTDNTPALPVTEAGRMADAATFHSPTCDKSALMDGHCTCGWTPLILAIEAEAAQARDPIITALDRCPKCGRTARMGEVAQVRDVIGVPTEMAEALARCQEARQAEAEAAQVRDGELLAALRGYHAVEHCDACKAARALIESDRG